MKLFLTAILSVSLAASQNRFEVASVKPAATPDGRALLRAVPGRLEMTNIALRRLILIAWGVQDFQLVGEPAWTRNTNFDILAKTEGLTSVKEMEGPMLQALLEERFNMKLHRETRELPVYILTTAKGGVKIQPSKEGTCTPYSVDAPPTATSGPPPIPYCGLKPGVASLNRTLDGSGVTMSVLATSLGRSYTSDVGKNIIDRTALPGTFDIHLQWSTEDSPSLFTALQEQLGLKLEPAKGPVKVLVIDQIEKPSAN